MNPFIDRTVSEIGRHGLVADRQHVSLDDYQSTAAWVLLGDAGSGKTRQLKYEVAQAIARHERAEYITARDFVTFQGAQAQWKNATLFIDALDEVRATNLDTQWYFDLLRRYLNQLGKPKFRIACRDAHWFGEIDQDHLTTVSADSNLIMLRLDGFDTVRVRTCLSTYENIDNVDAFIEEAERHRVAELLASPQNLHMMAQLVTRDREWPTSRFELYSGLCERMTLEINPQHGIPHRNNPSPNEALDVAGRICSLQLLTDRQDCVTTATAQRPGALTIRDVPSKHSDAVIQTLATSLFQTGPHGGRIPVHRSIAEFLAARHLAHLIDDGLPAKRVLALISGADGVVITPFRGLSAWMATHSTTSRSTIIKRDPIGVALYADLTRFDLEQKRILLNALFKHLDTQTDGKALSTTYARVISPEFSSIIRPILKKDTSSISNLRIVCLVLDMLSNTPYSDPYTDIFLELITDNGQPYEVKTGALHALIENHKQHPHDATDLLNLLNQTRSKVVSDPYDELAGQLLSYLYPQYLSADCVVNYLHDHANIRNHGSYIKFWTRGIVERSQSADAIAVLNSIAEDTEKHYESIRKYSLYELPFRLIVRTLPVCDDPKYFEQLYSWLQMASFIANNRPHLAGKEKSEIQCWIEARPKVAMYLIEKEFTLQFLDDEEQSHWKNSGDILIGAVPPREFGKWCLHKAVIIARSRPVLAVNLLLQCYRRFTVNKCRYDLSLDQIQHTAHLIGYTKPLAAGYAHQLTDRDSDHLEREEVHRWVEQLRNDVDIVSDQARNAQILHTVGRAYFGLIHELDDVTEIAAIRELLEWDTRLITPVEQSLMGLLERSDLPSVEEIGDLFAAHRRHVLGLPFLACVDYVSPHGTIGSRTISPHHVDRAVAFFYAEPYLPTPSARFRSLLNADPEATIRVLTRMTVVDVRTRRHAPWKAWTISQLLRNPEDKRRASFEIALRYPLRCTSVQVEALDSHLWNILSPEDEVLRTVASSKLSKKALGVGQRVRWLMIATLLEPEKFVREFEQFVARSSQRITHLATFLCTIANDNYDQFRVCLRTLQAQAQVCILEVMIRIFGRYASPADQTRSGWVDSKVDMSRFVTLLIEFLSTIPSHEAGGLFESLHNDATLVKWGEDLYFYRERQSALARDAQFTYPSVSAVNQVLEGGKPANPADLHALVVDQLFSIGESYRVDHANLWRKFWNEDSHGRPRKRKVEESCRDFLLVDLRDRLPRGAEVSGEARFVHGNRADLLVTHGDCAVAIEVKVATNRSVWVGLRNQLLDKYGKHPSTWGYGVYVVLWFGTPSADASKGESSSSDPDRMRFELIRRANLSESERRKVEVIFIDLSVPRISPDSENRSFELTTNEA